MKSEYIQLISIYLNLYKIYKMFPTRYILNIFELVLNEQHLDGKLLITIICY